MTMKKKTKMAIWHLAFPVVFIGMFLVTFYFALDYLIIGDTSIMMDGNPEFEQGLINSTRAGWLIIITGIVALASIPLSWARAGYLLLEGRRRSKKE